MESHGAPRSCPSYRRRFWRPLITETNVYRASSLRQAQHPGLAPVEPLWLTRALGNGKYGYTNGNHVGREAVPTSPGQQ